ncbi:NUDIX hydrolase domain-like protein, partial [Dimargaris cristalligena]
RVAVVVVLYRRSDQRVLIGQRKGGLGNGCWELPGGSIEFGETFTDSCLREIREETGLEATAVRFICPKTIIFPEAQKHWISLFFSAECVDEDPQPVTMEPDKSDGWIWASWQELR